MEPGFDSSSYTAEIAGGSTPGALFPLSSSSQIRYPTEMGPVWVKDAVPSQKIHTSEIPTLICPLYSFQPPL